jgi:hypothetical protein
MVNPNLGKPVSNKHKVPKHHWAKWSNHARRVFNRMMHSLRPSMQFAFLHPDATAASRAHWATTRWNAAWMAASAADGNGQSADATSLPIQKRAAKKTKRARRGR